MSVEENTDDIEVKRTSKLTALIAQENEGINGLQVTVYYSENNWETCEEVNLILDDNTTINQLIDSALYKFKTELFYDNIDKKQFNVMLFKKKKKVPNEEYPICNPESKVKDYGKIHFCLVEDNIIKEEIQEKVEEKKEIIKHDNNIDNKQNKKVNRVNDNQVKQEDIDKKYKPCSAKCIVF